MGVQKVTTTVYTCDRCKRTTTTEHGLGGQCGTLTLDHSGVTYDGATGGATIRAWLCGNCTATLLAFLRDRPFDPGKGR